MNNFCIFASIFLLLAKASESENKHGRSESANLNANLENEREMVMFFEECKHGTLVDRLAVAERPSDKAKLYKEMVDEVCKTLEWQPLANMLVTSKKADDLVANAFMVLAGQGPFERLSLDVRRDIARQLFQDPKKGNSRLTRFLVKFHQSFDLFKDSLTRTDEGYTAKRLRLKEEYKEKKRKLQNDYKIKVRKSRNDDEESKRKRKYKGKRRFKPKERYYSDDDDDDDKEFTGNHIAAAIISVILGMEGVLEDDDRIKLLDNLENLFPDSFIVGEACELNNTLSSKSSMGEIQNACRQNVLLQDCLIFAIRTTSIELQTAYRFYSELGRIKKYPSDFETDYTFLLDTAFVSRHQIDEDEQQKLMGQWSASSILREILQRPNLTGLNTKLLLSLDPRSDIAANSLGSLVTMYCFDETGVVWEKYQKQLHKLPRELLYDILLGFSYGKFLSDEQKVKLFTAIGEKTFAELVLTHKDDRAGLLALGFDAQEKWYKERFIQDLSKADFASFLNFTLANHRYQFIEYFIIKDRNHWVAKCIVEHVGDSLDVLKKLNITDATILCLMFLLTDHENIARFLRDRLLEMNPFRDLLTRKFSQTSVVMAIKRNRQLKEMKESIYRSNTKIPDFLYSVLKTD